MTAQLIRFPIIPRNTCLIRAIEPPKREIYWHRGGQIYAERRCGDVSMLLAADISRHLLFLVELMTRLKDLGERALFDEVHDQVKQLLDAREQADIWRLMFKVEPHEL